MTSARTVALIAASGRPRDWLMSLANSDGSSLLPTNAQRATTEAFASNGDFKKPEKRITRLSSDRHSGSGF